MNALVFSAEEASKLVALQTGVHRLSPVELTDGRFFLTDDVLSEVPTGIFGSSLNEVEYETLPFSEIEPFLFVSEEV